jgi:hypothetical protein
VSVHQDLKIDDRTLISTASSHIGCRKGTTERTIRDTRGSTELTANMRGRISGGRKQLTKKRSAMIRVAAGVPEGSPLAPRSTADATIAIISVVATEELKYFAAYGLSTRSLDQFQQLGYNHQSRFMCFSMHSLRNRHRPPIPAESDLSASRVGKRRAGGHSMSFEHNSVNACGGGLHRLSPLHTCCHSQHRQQKK